MCSDETIEQEAQILTAKSYRYCDDKNLIYVRCLSCDNCVCNRCIKGALKRIEDEIPSHIINQDKTGRILLDLNKLLDDRDEESSNAELTIPIGHCCVIKADIPLDTKRSVAACSLFDNDEDYTDDCGSDYETGLSDDLFFNDDKEAVRKIRFSLKSAVEDEGAVEHLHGYFNDAKRHSHEGILKIRRPKTILYKENRKRRKRKSNSKWDSRNEHNPFEGALVVPLYGLIITADANNNWLVCDHLAHAKSMDVDDNTPAVSHAVLSRKSACRLNEYMKTNEHELKRIIMNTESVKRETIVVENVEPPEGDGRRRSFTVEVIEMKQFLSLSALSKQYKNGFNDFSANDFCAYHIFGNNDIKDNVDATMIIGDFCLEDDSTIVGKKLLLFRFSGMASNAMNWGGSDEHGKLGTARTLYNFILPMCGKRGFELNRFGGSSGITDHAADKDLLFVLHKHEATLPRKVYGTFILRDRLKYYFVYRKCNKKGFAIACYSPPKEGGQFSLPHSLLATTKYPFLSEMTYLKMLTVLIMRSFNEQYSGRFGKVACGPLKCEMGKIETARREVELALADLPSPNSKLLHLLKSFNDLHHYSLVAHPVGLHYDTFKEGDESLENKLLLCSLPPNNISKGRGGSLVNDVFVFALLDW